MPENDGGLVRLGTEVEPVGADAVFPEPRREPAVPFVDRPVEVGAVARERRGGDARIVEILRRHPALGKQLVRQPLFDGAQPRLVRVVGAVEALACLEIEHEMLERPQGVEAALVVGATRVELELEQVGNDTIRHRHRCVEERLVRFALEVDRGHSERGGDHRAVVGEVRPEFEHVVRRSGRHHLEVVHHLVANVRAFVGCRRVEEQVVADRERPQSFGRPGFVVVGLVGVGDIRGQRLPPRDRHRVRRRFEVTHQRDVRDGLEAVPRSQHQRVGPGREKRLDAAANECVGVVVGAAVVNLGHETRDVARREEQPGMVRTVEGIGQDGLRRRRARGDQ